MNDTNEFSSHDWFIPPVGHAYDGRPLAEFPDPMLLAFERVRIRFHGAIPRDVSLALNDAYRRGLRDKARAEVVADNERDRNVRQDGISNDVPAVSADTPAVKMAVTVASAQSQRGEPTDPNVTAVLLMALEGERARREALQAALRTALGMYNKSPNYALSLIHDALAAEAQDMSAVIEPPVDAETAALVQRIANTVVDDSAVMPVFEDDAVPAGPAGDREDRP